MDPQYFSLSRGKILLSYGLPYLPHRIQSQIIQLFTLFIINQQLGIAAAGVYSVVNKFTKPLSLIIGSIQTAWVPYKFHLHKTESNPSPIFRSITGNYWMVLILMWSIACLIFPFLFKLLVNERYHLGLNYFPFLAFIGMSEGFFWTVSTGIELRKSQIILPIATFFGMITLILISLLTVNYYFPYGTILAQSLALYVMSLIVYRYARKIMTINYPFLLAVFYLSLSMLMIFTNYLTGQTTLVSIMFIIIEVILFIFIILDFNNKTINFTSKKLIT
jgi:O-antigen/teichoic acid export membrane protein